MLDPFLARLARELGQQSSRLIELEKDLFAGDEPRQSLQARGMAREAQELVFRLYEPHDSMREFLNDAADTIDSHARTLHWMGTLLWRAKKELLSRLCDGLAMESVKIAATIQDRTPNWR